MPDYLDKLALDAQETIAENYYEVSEATGKFSVSLKKAITENTQNSVITEVKAASPSRGTIKAFFEAAVVAKTMEKGGAIAISVLTEPKHFNGSLTHLAKVREAVKVPVLMKDFFLNPIQIEAASKMGANVILLIQALFDRGYSELSLEEMIKKAHSRGLEVLLETHSEEEFRQAIETDADLVGINNRDLRTLNIDLKTTQRILENIESKNKLVISESGIMNPQDLLFLRNCGAQAFLIGSSVMMADNIEQKVKEFVTAQ